MATNFAPQLGSGPLPVGRPVDEVIHRNETFALPKTQHFNFFATCPSGPTFYLNNLGFGTDELRLSPGTQSPDGTTLADLITGS